MSLSLSPSASTTPFAQQSPPPRRKPPPILNPGQSNEIHPSPNPSQQTFGCSAPFHQALKNSATHHPKATSRIPFQWRVGTSLVQPPGDSADHPSSTLPQFQPLAPSPSQSTTAKFGNIFASTNISPATTSKEQLPPRKLSSITNFLRSHSTSSDHSSASSSSLSSSSSPISLVPPALDSTLSRIQLDQVVLDPSYSIGALPSPISSNSDHKVLETHSCSSSPPSSRTSKLSASSSCSFHFALDSDLESFEDEDCQQEVLSPTPNSHLLLVPRCVKTPTPSQSPGPDSTSTPTSHSFHHLPPNSQSSPSSNTLSHSSPWSTSSTPQVSHVTPPSVTDLPFACPSPVVPSRCVKSRPTRPVPTRAPPLPRSQTPSLVIRPKLSLSSALDFDVQPAQSQSGSSVPSQNISIDPRVGLEQRPISNSKTDMIRHLGWGPSPINPTCSPSPALPHLASQSASSIDLTTLEFLAPYRPLGAAQASPVADVFVTSGVRSSSPRRQVDVLRPKPKKFRDRFTITNTAPLKITKRQKTHHADNLASTSETGRRIVSGLLNVLSPTGASHVIDNPVNERRKAEFKKTISYPVLNHTSGDDTFSHCAHEEHHGDDTECYNLTIEAAVRSLEGIRSPGSSPRVARQASCNMLSSNLSQGVPTPSSQCDRNLDTSAAVATQSEETSQLWKRKLRRRISSKLLAKSNRNLTGDDGNESDCPSIGLSRRPQASHKQLRRKASARLKPLLHRVSSLSLRHFTGAEADQSSESSKIANNVDEHNEEEELVLIPDENMASSSISGVYSELKPDSRFRWIHSSLSKRKSARSVPSSTVGLATPKSHQDPPVIKSSQSIREKRKIFEPEADNQLNNSLFDFPTLSHSSLSASLASSDQRALRDARLSIGPASKRSSVRSHRQLPNRKPTPAEIKLKDEARSVKALVNKFEHQSHSSLPRSVGSDCLADSQRTWDGGRSSSTGFVRNSLASIWSGGVSTLSSTRSSKQLSREQRRKRRGWSSGYTFSNTSECANEEENVPIQKKKKKKKKKQKPWSQSIFQNDDSSFSSFGCDLRERDEEDYETGPFSDHTELTDSHELSSYHLATMQSTSSNGPSRSTCSGLSSHDASMKNAEENLSDFNRQSLQSSNNANVEFESVGSCLSDNQDDVDHELQAPSDHKLAVQENPPKNKTWSLLSSEQARTVLEPQTVWMGDGSARKILVVGGRLQMAKKIPFPSFEDDAEFSQPVSLPQPPPTTEEPVSSKSIPKTAAKNDQDNRISSFLRTRKFELEESEDGDKDRSEDHSCIQMGSKMTLGSRMMCADDAVSLQDSPTHGRGRRSLGKSLYMSASERSYSGSPERPRLIPHLLLDPASDLVGEKDKHPNSSSATGSPNSVEMKQMHLSVDRCQGLGNKMFGSSINALRHLSPPSPARSSSRRSASTIESCTLFRLTPNKSRPHSQPPMSMSKVDVIISGFDAFGSAHVNGSRSPLISTSSRSSILGCDILDRGQNENSTAITDLMVSHEETSPLKQSNISIQPVSFTQRDLKTPKNRNNDDGPQNSTDPNEVLKFELARLERVQEKWRKFCLEVEDVLKKSRERWPEHVEPDKVLGEFRRPTTKSTFGTFLANSQQLHRDESVETTQWTRLPQSSRQDVNSQLTPPSKHPFDSRPMTPSTVAGYPSLNDSGLVTQSPHIVTLPVPSAFVSPERFLGSESRITEVESERGPRVIKISNRSRHFGLRQQTLSNRLGSTDLKSATDRHRHARLISVTSSNVSFNSAGKAVLAEKSVNQSPVTFNNPIRSVDETSKSLSSPKIAAEQNVKSFASLSRANRRSPAKWAQENEGSSWMSASIRETRKPWKRSALNPNSHKGTQDGLINSSFTSNGSTEEVGVLVADGDQPHEFSDGFHASGSLRLKHLRRLNQSRSDRSIGKGARRIHSKLSKSELGVASITKKASLPTVNNRQTFEHKNSIGNFESNKNKSPFNAVPLINHRI